LVAWKAGNVWQYGLFVDDVTGLIVIADDNAQTILSGVPEMVMARVKPIALNYAMIAKPFAMNGVKAARIRSRWYEEFSRIAPAQSNLDPPGAYISVVNESSQ